MKTKEKIIEEIMDNFKDEFGIENKFGIHFPKLNADKVIHFFNKEICRALSLQTQEIVEERNKNISLLRQWLNEDRITDPKKMITNEQILTWFTNPN